MNVMANIQWSPSAEKLDRVARTPLQCKLEFISSQWIINAMQCMECEPLCFIFNVNILFRTSHQTVRAWL